MKIKIRKFRHIFNVKQTSFYRKEKLQNKIIIVIFYLLAKLLKSKEKINKN